MIETAEPRPAQRRARLLPPLRATLAAARWFLYSDIQDERGAVARYYRTDTAQLAPVSTELTGYTVAALVYLYQRIQDPACLEAARRAARFLTRTAWDPALQTIPFELPDCDGARLAYFFDLGIIARGLLSLWRVTGERELLDAAGAAARSMLSDFGNPPVQHAAIALPSRAPIVPDGRWSRSPGCYQLKAALAWLELAEITGDAALARPYDEFLAAALEDHAGFLTSESCSERLMDRLHAYCYFLEGLLPRADRPECAAALGSGLASVQERLDDIAPAFERADVWAQILRLRLYCAALGVAPLDLSRARHEAARVRSFQYRSPDPRLRGGYCFGKRQGKRLPFANPATTVFATQALEQWRDYRRGVFKPSISELI
ncbi:MAG: hypothetical protein K6T61_04125 [Bryobacteraceae bacterium]|nr:hypothetical protein [Bryobacteraceae bacterium]